MPIEHVNKSQWQELAPAFCDYNYRHLWDYGLAVAQRRQATCEHIAIKADSQTIGLADVRIKKIPMIGGGIAYISGGPLTRRGKSTDIENLSIVLRELIQNYCHERDLILRVQCPIGPEEWMLQTTRAFEAAGFVRTDRSAQYRTMVVDISRPLPEIRAGFAQKWRNCLNASERKGMKIVAGRRDDLFGTFCEIFDRFHERKGFAVELDAQFYRKLQSHMAAEERLIVSIAELDGQIAAGHVSSSLGDTTVYLLGATTEAGLKAKAAYLLQWDAILHAKSRGSIWYDLGGIDPGANPGVYHFKAGMSGRDFVSPGPFEYQLPRWRSRLTKGFESAFRTLRPKPDSRHDHAKMSSSAEKAADSI